MHREDLHRRRLWWEGPRRGRDFAVLRLSEMPAVLAELEFLTNPAQLAVLADSETQHLLVLAVAGGIDALD